MTFNVPTQIFVYWGKMTTIRIICMFEAVKSKSENVMCIRQRCQNTGSKHSFYLRYIEFGTHEWKRKKGDHTHKHAQQ